MASLRQQLEALINELSPNMEKAFREAIEEIKSEIVLREIVERLERRDIEGAIDALHIDPAAFRPLSDALREAFNQGGILTVQNIPRLFDPMGGRVVFRWDVTNQAAEANIRDLSSTMITNITEDTRTMVRERIVAGYAQGQGPNTIATSIAGRINKVTRKRDGGALGITTQLGRTVENARLALATGDVEGMKAYLRLNRRDKRFDRTVMAAIRAGKALPAEDVAKITTALTNRYIQLRAETVARTETAMAVMNAKHQAYLQALDKAGRDTSLVTRKWRSAGDRRVRHTHAILNAQEVTGMDTPFQSPSGALLRFPGDTSLGAGAGEVVNCFAPWTRISPAGLVAAVAHEYSGDLVELAVGGDVYLSVTPNHPILTHRGWVPAGHVVEGDKFINRTVTDRVGATEPDVRNTDPRADELYDAAKALGHSVRASRGVVNFHGHMPNHDVDVVTLPRELRDALKPALRKAFGDITLAETDISKGRLVFDRIVGVGALSNPFSANGFMGLCRSVSTLLGREERRATQVTVSHAREVVAKVFEARIDDTARATNRACNRKDGMSFVVKLFDAIKVLVATFGMSGRAHLAFNAGYLAPTAHLQPKVSHATANDTIRDTKSRSNSMNGQTFGIEGSDLVKVFGPSLPSDLDRTDWSLSSVTVSHVRRVPYVGLVYDFQTENGLIIADNNVAHNCRCDVSYIFDFAESYARSRGR